LFDVTAARASPTYLWLPYCPSFSVPPCSWSCAQLKHPPFSSGLPIYHSKPGSTNVIIVDFDGHAETAASSEWGAFDNAGYNPRGTAGQFDSIEQREIGLVWARMAEDYAPFDVDVTTEEPSVLTRTTLRCLIATNRDRNGKLMPSADEAGGEEQHTGAASPLALPPFPFR
jgi:hypothetical protein